MKASNPASPNLVPNVARGRAKPSRGSSRQHMRHEMFFLHRSNVCQSLDSRKHGPQLTLNDTAGASSKRSACAQHPNQRRDKLQQHSMPNVPIAGAGQNANDGYGWGRVNMRQSLAPAPPVTFLARDDSAVAAGRTVRYEFTLPPDTQLLRVTLIWTDPPGNASVNNLNLRMTTPPFPPGGAARVCWQSLADGGHTSVQRPLTGRAAGKSFRDSASDRTDRHSRSADTSGRNIHCRSHCGNV